MMIREIDWRAPLDAFSPLAGRPWAVLLHAGEAARRPGWSVIAAGPAARLEARGGETLIDGARAGADPFAALAGLHQRRRRAASGQSPRPSFGAGGPPPFLTGLIGFAGYEMGGVLEPSAKGPASPFLLPDMAFAAYDAAALFNRGQKRAFIAATDAAAGEALEAMLGKEAAAAPRAPAFFSLRSNFTGETYRTMVGAIVERIRDGALFQANVAQLLSAAGGEDAAVFDIFRRLASGDAPYAAFLQYEDGAILSNSPERFFRIAPEPAGARIVAEPIKGTRPRGKTADADAMLAAELLADPKERAENIMIADLMRNDLSRVCRDGSIREEAICELASGEHVHHLVSRIGGVLREALTPVDALAALFPCGSITGAPKIEAMKTIAEFETVGRGPYCGAIGYIGDDGAADFSVAIRTMIVEKASGETRAVFPVGGGVTLRSDPDAEYRETLVKARGALDALALDEGALR
jgi:para-aminobenzoate synthetase component 1